MNQTRRDFLQLVVVVGGASLVGCGGDGGTDGGMDSGGRTDTGGGGTDTGGGGTDTGGSGTDTGGGGTDTGGGGTDTGGGGCTAPTASIATNHPAPGAHTLTVPLADVTAGADRTYDITGGSRHMHSITITAAQFTMLRAGTTIMVTSTSGGMHTHVCTIRCA